MDAGRFRNGWRYGFAAATLVAPLAHAQDAPTPTPSPSPVIVPSQRPQSLPGVIPERFNLAPAPTPTPAPVPPPSPIPTTQASPVARATPAPRATPLPRRDASRTVTPVPMASSPAPVIVATPAVQAAPVPQPTASAPPVAGAEPSASPWLWAAAGAGSSALLGLGAWLLLRRRRKEEEEAVEVAPAVAEPVPAAPPPPVRQPPGLAASTPAAVPAPVARSSDPFELQLNPHRIVFGENEVLLEFELLIGNRTGTSAENIRVAFAAMSAHARQDEMIAGFHGGPPGEPGGAPFDLPAEGGGRMPVRLAIPRAGVNVVQLNGRPMFVPIVLIDLRWRGGLSVRRFGADFILGTAGQGSKLGPLWLDRPAPAGRLAANRYFAKEAAAA